MDMLSLTRSVKAEVIVNKQALNLVLTDKERSLRDERWRFCRVVVDMSSTSKMNHKQCCGVIASRDNELYPLLSQKGKGGKSALTYHNLRYWLGNNTGIGFSRCKGSKVYNWDNIDALADRYRRGEQPERVDNRILNVLKAAYLDPRQLPMTVVYQQTRELFDREFPELEFPSYEQAKYRLKKIPKLLFESGRYGIDYVMNRDLYMLIRNWDMILSGQCYFADTRTADSWVRIPDDSGNGWRAVRPQIVFVMDARSWYCVGFDTTAGDSPDSDMIRNIFTRACMEKGIPDFFYIDNGKDYNKRGFTTPVEIDKRELCIIKSLGIKLVNSKPYMGRAKTVERRFKEDAQNFDKRQPSYCGNAPGNGPDGAELWREGDNVMLLPTLGQYNEKFGREIEKFHRKPMGGHLKGKTPYEVFHGPARIQKAPMSEKELYRAFMLPHAKERKVFHGGCVRFNRVQYYAPELFDFTGKEVIIKSHFLENASLHAFTIDDRYICECTAQAMTHPLAHYLGDDEDKHTLDEQLVIQGRQRKKIIKERNELTGGLYGLALDQICSLRREQLEGGFKPVTAASRSKVKSGDHNIKLLVTPEHLANVEKEKAAARIKPVKQLAAASKSTKQIEFERKLDVALLGGKTEQKQAFKLENETIQDPETPAFVLKTDTSASK